MTEPKTAIQFSTADIAARLEIPLRTAQYICRSALRNREARKHGRFSEEDFLAIKAYHDRFRRANPNKENKVA